MAYELFHLLIPVLTLFSPEFLRLQHLAAAVVKVHAHLHHFRRRREFLLFISRDIRELQFIFAGIRFDANTFWQSYFNVVDPVSHIAVSRIYFVVVQGERGIGKPGTLLSKLGLNNPACGNNVVVTPDDGITPLDDATYLYIRKGEGLHLHFQAMAFYDCLVKCLSGKWSNRPVGRNGSGLHSCDMGTKMVFCMIGNFHISITLAFFRENFDPPVLVAIFPDVVGNRFMVENDGFRVAGLFAGQLQVFLRDWLPIVKGKHRRRRQKQNSGKNTQDAQEDTSYQQITTVSLRTRLQQGRPAGNIPWSILLSV